MRFVLNNEPDRPLTHNCGSMNKPDSENPSAKKSDLVTESPIVPSPKPDSPRKARKAPHRSGGSGASERIVDASPPDARGDDKSEPQDGKIRSPAKPPLVPKEQLSYQELEQSEWGNVADAGKRNSVFNSAAFIGIVA